MTIEDLIEAVPAAAANHDLYCSVLCRAFERGVESARCWLGEERLNGCLSDFLKELSVWDWSHTGPESRLSGEMYAVAS